MRRHGSVSATTGFLNRTDQQFHWLNRGYATLRRFSRRRWRRASARRSARSASRRLPRASPSNCYAERRSRKRTGTRSSLSTWTPAARKWGRPYLNRQFFSLLGERMADHCLLIMAKRARALRCGRPQSHRRRRALRPLLGRIEHHPCLHFEVCYYQAIDYAIAHGLARVEAGAQGEHKLARGYLPVRRTRRTTSATRACGEPSTAISTRSAAMSPASARC